MSALNLKDFYKVDHRSQYAPGTTLIYSNLTARISRIPGIDKVLVCNVEAALEEWLVNAFQLTFFSQPKELAIGIYKRRIETSLGAGTITFEHIEQLHDLGYLPVEIKSLDEGTLCPLRVPILTIKNTLPEFAWVTNFLETLLSMILWHPITTGTIAFEYRKILSLAAKETNPEMMDFVKWQGHDFSMRGLTHPMGAAASGAAHLLSFTGTDTIPAIDYLEAYYNADADKELIGGSVPATEHSVMCVGLAKETEEETFRRLITKTYPKGIVSIVSDTLDFFYTLSVTVKNLKPEIEARDGKVVIRPDSGDPFKIICGDQDAPEHSLERAGAIDILWETFGGTKTSTGFKQLNSKIGLIYGDSITLDKCKQILDGLKAKGYASTNMVFGIGSYTYQYVTRDTFGFALKATYAQINGEGYALFKDPKTDGGVKKSAKGLLKVNEDLTLSEQVSLSEENTGLLKTVFKNGRIVRRTTLKEIRDRVDGRINELLQQN